MGGKGCFGWIFLAVLKIWLRGGGFLSHWEGKMLWAGGKEQATALWLGNGGGREADFSTAQLTMRL
jgi:hypothetical protein